MKVSKEILVTSFLSIFITLLLVSFIKSTQKNDINEYAYIALYKKDGRINVSKVIKGEKLFKNINPQFYLLKTKSDSITLQNISLYDDKFKPFPTKERFQNSDLNYWLKVDLGTNFPSGRFIYTYDGIDGIDFSQSSIKASQSLEKFNFNGKKNIVFTYRKGDDPSIYYFKLISKKDDANLVFISVSTMDRFYSYINKTLPLRFFLGIIIGIVIMAGIYNGAIYFFNRDRAFLYYALMQLFMVQTLILISGLLVCSKSYMLFSSESYYNFIVLATALFAGLFAIEFLDIKNFSKVLFLVFQVALILIALDMIIGIFDHSFILKYHLLPILILPLLYAGYKRAQAGYKAALFYLAGWISLGITTFIDGYRIDYERYLISPLFIGVPVEAILFSLALSYKMRMIAKEKEEQKELLIHQSKLASMGELLGNIAHQWRQPLTFLGYTFMNMKETLKSSQFDKKYFEKKLDEAEKQLLYLSQTIDDFKDFYVPKKEKEIFSLHEAIKETLEIAKDMLISNDIEIDIILREDRQLYSYKNDIKHVVLNLLTNAKEAFVERKVKNPKITISIDKNTITISDNAGGIDKNIIEHIFEPYFTTKEGNSGIGLYISKMILEKNLQATISIDNGKNGIVSKIEFL